MKNLAPEITRQRLLIEGLYKTNVDESVVSDFLTSLANELELRHYGKPAIHAPEGIGKECNEGFDAFLPLIDSGISLYIWTSSRFFAMVIFTCKKFDNQKAISFTKNYFTTEEIEFREF